MRVVERFAGRMLALVATVGCSGGAWPGGARCVASETVITFAVTNIDRRDVLFVISDAASMVAEQAVLRQELPAIVRALATREIDGVQYGGLEQGLHVAVVAASLADGVALHRVPAASDGGCSVEYPSFLHYSGST